MDKKNEHQCLNLDEGIMIVCIGSVWWFKAGFRMTCVALSAIFDSTQH